MVMLKDHGLGLRVGIAPTWVLGRGAASLADGTGSHHQKGSLLCATHPFGASCVDGEGGEQGIRVFSPGRVASEVSPCLLGAAWVTYPPFGHTGAYTHLSSLTAPKLNIC